MNSFDFISFRIFNGNTLNFRYGNIISVSRDYLLMDWLLIWTFKTKYKNEIDKYKNM